MKYYFVTLPSPSRLRLDQRDYSLKEFRYPFLDAFKAYQIKKNGERSQINIGGDSETGQGEVETRYLLKYFNAIDGAANGQKNGSISGAEYEAFYAQQKNELEKNASARRRYKRTKFDNQNEILIFDPSRLPYYKAILKS